MKVPTRSAVALPFWMKDQQIGVFFLRTTGDDPPLTRADAQFAETVIKTAVSAIEKAYDFESAVSDKQRLEKLAATDALTGLTNRRGLSEALTQELDRARRYNLALTILLADIDRFKTINDTRGHIAGDSVLRQVGELLRREARSVDIVARYGGEEFVVVMPETATQGAAIFAERVRLRVQNLISPIPAMIPSTLRSASDSLRFPTIASTVPTTSCRSPIKPSIAPRTKGATWSGNERAPLPEMRVRVYRYGRPLLSEGRQHARGDPGEEAAAPPAAGRRHRAVAPASARRCRPAKPVSTRLQPLESDPGCPLSVLKKLGEGGMSYVYLAKEISSDATVAIKVLSPRLASDKSSVERLRREAGLAMRLDHPNVCRICGSRVGRRADLFGDAVPQGRAAVRPGSARRPDGDDARREVAEADVRRPASAHELQIIHRDLKPENVMLVPGDDDGVERAVVMDFVWPRSGAPIRRSRSSQRPASFSAHRSS